MTTHAMQTHTHTHTHTRAHARTHVRTYIHSKVGALQHMGRRKEKNKATKLSIIKILLCNYYSLRHCLHNLCVFFVVLIRVFVHGALKSSLQGYRLLHLTE